MLSVLSSLRLPERQSHRAVRTNLCGCRSGNP